MAVDCHLFVANKIIWRHSKMGMDGYIELINIVHLGGGKLLVRKMAAVWAKNSNFQQE